MQRFHCNRLIEYALRQCQETIDAFQGSEETLRHIQRVEETLRTLVPLRN